MRVFLLALLCAAVPARAQEDGEEPVTVEEPASEQAAAEAPAAEEPASAQEAAEEPEPDTAPTTLLREPAIHGRPAPEDVGKPPKSVARPPRDIGELTTKQCQSYPSDLEKYRAYQQEKLLWNLRKIASLGGSCGIGACAQAKDAFEKAAALSGNVRAEKEFDAASKEAFEKATSCRKGLKALYIRECGGQPGDAECKGAELDVKVSAYLDDQNAKFNKELAAREEEGLDLSLCVGTGARIASLNERKAKSNEKASGMPLESTARASRGKNLGQRASKGAGSGSPAWPGRRIGGSASASMRVSRGLGAGQAPASASAANRSIRSAVAGAAPGQERAALRGTGATAPSIGAPPSRHGASLSAAAPAAPVTDCPALDTTVIVPGVAKVRNTHRAGIEQLRISPGTKLALLNSEVSKVGALIDLVRSAEGVRNSTRDRVQAAQNEVNVCKSNCRAANCDSVCRSFGPTDADLRDAAVAAAVFDGFSAVLADAERQAVPLCSGKPVKKLVSLSIAPPSPILVAPGGSVSLTAKPTFAPTPKDGINAEIKIEWLPPEPATLGTLNAKTGNVVTLTLGPKATQGTVTARDALSGISGKATITVKQATCTGGKIEAGKCKCPTDKILQGGSCTTCPVGQVPDKSGGADGVCVPKLRTDGCPATNPMCIDSGKAKPEWTTPSVALNAEQRKAINQSLRTLAESNTGKKLLAALCPNCAGFDLAALSGQGIEVRVAKKPLKGGGAETYPGRTKDGKWFVAMVLDARVFKESDRAQAPLLGHELTHALEPRVHSSLSRSFELPEEGAYLNTAYIARELRSKGLLCHELKHFCQWGNATLRIWEDRLLEKPPEAGEFVIRPAIDRLTAAQESEKANIRGTDEIIRDAGTQKKAASPPEYLKAMRDADTAYRRNNQAELK